MAELSMALTKGGGFPSNSQRVVGASGKVYQRVGLTELLARAS